ncbi:MAG: hypothetical protein SVO01_00385 [Thermotogota bacterium]|nr:hypothetical protein [Thermotogota bacterium]
MENTNLNLDYHGISWSLTKRIKVMLGQAGLVFVGYQERTRGKVPLVLFNDENGFTYNIPVDEFSLDAISSIEKHEKASAVFCKVCGGVDAHTLQCKYSKLGG